MDIVLMNEVDLEVFASMLNKGDVLQIYPMHPITVNNSEYTMKNPFTITDASEASTIRQIFTKKAGGTPIESVDAAAEGVKKLQADQKYMIVLTDGDSFYKNAQSCGTPCENPPCRCRPKSGPAPRYQRHIS